MEEEKFLKRLEEDLKEKKFGSRKDNIQMWYNKDGDCVHFQKVHVAIVRDRVDEYLTVYRSAENDEPIGFQLKDVNALIDRYELDGMVIEATFKGDKLISVTRLILKAFSKSNSTINRLSGYGDALKVLTKERDNVAIPV